VKKAEGERRRRFDRLFESHNVEIVAYCRSRAGSASDAQDAAAEVFLTAWRRVDDVPEGDAALAWLYATARRVLANQRRSARRSAALAERLALTPPPQRPPVDAEDSLVHEALRKLNPIDREVLLLSEWEGLSPAQIASVLRCPKVTARGRLHRARRRFRSAFQELRSGDESVGYGHSAYRLATNSVTRVVGGG